MPREWYVQVISVTLQRPLPRRRRAEKIANNQFNVEWEPDTVDNEHMNKKKSKSTYATLAFLLHYTAVQKNYAHRPLKHTLVLVRSHHPIPRMLRLPQTQGV